MHDVVVRKQVVVVEEILHDGGPPPTTSQRKGAILAVVGNPFAGRYVEDIQPFMEDLKPLGLLMAGRLAEALGGPAAVTGHGKGAIVGAAGELEHGALWHARGGYAMREVLGNAKAIVPSTKKVGGPGTRLDVPVTHINASYVRGHFDAILAAFTEPYRKGSELAVEEINAAGGVLGRTLVVIAKDDGGKPAQAITAANELVSSEGVAMLTGTFHSNIWLAVADFAAQKKVFFLAGEPLTDAMTWSKGNKYTFRLRPSANMQAAMLADEAAKLPAKRRATIAPNYEYGQSAVAVFKQLLSARRPDVQWVAAQWPPVGKIDTGPVVQAVAAANPDAIFNVEFGPDLVKLVRDGETRGLFKARSVVSLLTGEPEYLDPLKDETPIGWIVTGYPWNDVGIPEHSAFLKAFEARFKDHPRVGSIVGFETIKAAAAIIAKAGSTDTDKLIAAGEGVELGSPLGPITFRAIDHQSTLGAFVGTTAVKDGKGVMVGSGYLDGANDLPSDATVKTLRPGT